MSAGEVNIRDSEFEELRLDQRFRRNDKMYQDLVNNLVERRLENFWPQSSSGRSGRARRLSEWFEEPKRDPFDPIFLRLVKSGPPEARPHMARLRAALSTNLARGDIPGVASAKDIDRIIEAVTFPEAPLLEKLNTVLVFNAWAHSTNLVDAAEAARDGCKEFAETRTTGKYRQKLEHYKSDLVAQMYREASVRQAYGGLDEFTRMSEGQPRALITLLKETFDWATFQGERPFEVGCISLEAESKGALAASDWFYKHMSRAGDEGRGVLIAIDRLAELFRINRYADNPIECSLIGFSASDRVGSAAARRVLRLAVDHSFLVEILGGQQERNSEQITSKYQLNRMLVPKWGLATGRRGIKPLNEQEFEAIFDPANEEGFNLVKMDWTSRMNAPFDRARKITKSLGDAAGVNNQADLFSS